LYPSGSCHLCCIAIIFRCLGKENPAAGTRAVCRLSREIFQARTSTSLVICSRSLGACVWISRDLDCKDYSDRGIAIMGETPLPPHILSALGEEVVDCSLPFNVDYRRLAKAKDSFRVIIRKYG